jgi:hypothetical protein
VSEGRLDRAGWSEQSGQEWLGAMQSLAERIQKHQELSQQMTQELVNTYVQLLNTPAPTSPGRPSSSSRPSSRAPSSGWSRPNSSSKPSSR